MSSVSAAIILATVIAVQGPTARIDSGGLEGLVEGLQGQVFYQLTVAGESKRIDVGTATVVHAGESDARITVKGGRVVYAGQQVEFTVSVPQPESPPASPPTPPLPPPPVVAPEPVHEVEAVEPAQIEPEPVVPVRAEPEHVELAEPLSVDESTAPLEVAPEDELRPAMATTQIAAGTYVVGLDRVDAEFFNQTPRFTTDVHSYRIDINPATDETGSLLRGMTFDAAERHCRERGARLPTEYEWEIAVQQGPFEISEGLLEWTTSWYQPYPGNQQSEAEYGQLHRVLRGSPAGSAFSPFARRFLAPERGNGQVGFRCVEEDR